MYLPYIQTVVKNVPPEQLLIQRADKKYLLNLTFLLSNRAKKKMSEISKAGAIGYIQRKLFNFHNFQEQLF